VLFCVFNHFYDPRILLDGEFNIGILKMGGEGLFNGSSKERFDSMTHGLPSSLLPMLSGVNDEFASSFAAGDMSLGF
jgi:hypothetical protein